MLISLLKAYTVFIATFFLMNGAKICQQTTKRRHILETTSYVIVTFHSFIVLVIQVTPIVHFQLEDFEFIAKLNK